MLYIEHLQQGKADRENVAIEMDVKADKHALDDKVNQSTFEETFQMFDRGILYRPLSPLNYLIRCFSYILCIHISR